MGLALMPFLILYFIIMLVLTVFLITKTNSKIRKMFYGVIIPVVFFILPLGDELIGTMYFKELCDKERGIVIHKKIYLPKESFDDSGKVKIQKKGFIFSNVVFDNRYHGSYTTQHISKTFNIKSKTYLIIDDLDKTVVAERTKYIFSKGWLANNIGTGVLLDICPSNYTSIDFINDVFNK